MLHVTHKECKAFFGSDSGACALRILILLPAVDFNEQLPVEGNVGSKPVPFAHHKVPESIKI